MPNISALQRRLSGSPHEAPLVGSERDAAKGNLYGTTLQDDGTIFELMPPNAGQIAWTEQTLWTFIGGDGVQPQTPLAFGTRGTLFGTRTDGEQYDNGTVFELSY